MILLDRYVSLCSTLEYMSLFLKQRLLNLEHLVVLLAGPIPHNSIHLLIITADFVALY